MEQMRLAVPPVSPGSDPRSAQHGQSGSSRGCGQWRGKGDDQNTSNGQALWSHFLLSSHNHLTSSHYHSHFMGEETEAQTSEEKYPRLSDGTEIQIQVWTAKPMSFSYHA